MESNHNDKLNEIISKYVPDHLKADAIHELDMLTAIRRDKLNEPNECKEEAADKLANNQNDAISIVERKNNVMSIYKLVVQQTNAKI